METVSSLAGKKTTEIVGNKVRVDRKVVLFQYVAYRAGRDRLRGNSHRWQCGVFDCNGHVLTPCPAASSPGFEAVTLPAHFTQSQCRYHHVLTVPLASQSGRPGRILSCAEPNGHVAGKKVGQREFQ
jgi:hypothetical protein